MNKSEKEHYDRMARCGCALCTHLGFRDTPAELHHIRTGNIPRKQSPVIPLCPEHHRGNTGIHGLGRKGFEAKYGISQESLLKKTLEMIGEIYE